MSPDNGRPGHRLRLVKERLGRSMWRLLAVTLLTTAGMTPVYADGDVPTKFSNIGTVGNTRHNLSQRQVSGGGPAGATMDSYRNDYLEVCVYCHTPHGASGTVAAPLWNRTMKTTTYQTYDLLNTGSLTQPISQPGVNSLTCLSCHEHRAQEHQVDAACATCHIPLAESGLSRGRIEAMRAPSDHEGEPFLAGGHGVSAGANVARCATCHTADRCVACHVDADRPEIAAMAFAPAEMDLPPAKAHYTTPASHEKGDWMGAHGADATRQACATCHTANDCQACHLAPLPAQVTQLPARGQVVAPGVGIAPHAPESHESFFFMEVHSVLAAGDQKSCNTCHVETFCVDCHEGPVGGGYHPTGFVARHSADAFGREADCANCHDTQVFCRNCHVQVGMTSVGRLGPGYHEGGGTWLLRHGQPARQNLESCTSCHKQNDCTQCHGVLGAFKISPHTRDFDARRAWAQSPRTCFACHIKNPLEGRAP